MAESPRSRLSVAVSALVSRRAGRVALVTGLAATWVVMAVGLATESAPLAAGGAVAAGVVLVAVTKLLLEVRIEASPTGAQLAAGPARVDGVARSASAPDQSADVTGRINHLAEDVAALAAELAGLRSTLVGSSDELPHQPRMWSGDLR